MNETVYDISIALNRVFVFDLGIGFDSVPRLSILHNGCCILGFLRNQTASNSNHNKVSYLKSGRRSCAVTPS